MSTSSRPDDWHRFVPQPPDYALPWERIEQAAWVAPLRTCRQDAEFHAEGDVWTHTRCVCEELVRGAEWRSLSEVARPILFWAALLHDVAKPLCTREDASGRIVSPGHARRGARVARRLLWDLEVPFAEREQVVALVRHHALPVWLITRAETERTLFETSQVARCDWLELLARADLRGREGLGVEDLLENVAAFGQLAREHECYSGPRPFADDVTRSEYFAGRWSTPDVATQKPFRADAIVLSGLPGAGKDTWISSQADGAEVISLDALRKELGIPPSQPQGQVIAAARERAAMLLRDNRSLIWNATNVTRELRTQCISFLESYGARVRIVYVEVGPRELERQNRHRDAAVPARAVERLLDRWEVPAPTEAVSVDYLIGGQLRDRFAGIC